MMDRHSIVLSIRVVRRSSARNASLRVSQPKIQLPTLRACAYHHNGGSVVEMIIKYTYSRHRSVSAQTDCPPAKRRRVNNEANEVDRQDTIPSCAHEACHSNGTIQNSTSSSSMEPPCLEPTSNATQTPPSTLTDTRLSEHSQLHESTQAIPSLCNNPRSPDPFDANVGNNEEWKAKKPSKPAKFTQMTLDLGQRIDKTCWICGMNYRPSNSEDYRLHQKFHSHRDILDFRMLTQTLLKSFMEENCVWRGNQDACIVEVRQGDSNTKKKFAETALDMVEEELGGVGIPKEELWNLTNGSTGDGDIGHRYKIYLYISGNKCVGVCLVQRVKRARRVMPPYTALERDCVPRIEVERNGRSPKGDGAIRICDEESPAMLGISRIWTSSGSRRQGIARRLLDCAIENFEFAISIPKDKVAFSQPTDSGAKLARAWFGKENGWLVYAE